MCTLQPRFACLFGLQGFRPGRLDAACSFPSTTESDAPGSGGSGGSSMVPTVGASPVPSRACLLFALPVPSDRSAPCAVPHHVPPPGCRRDAGRNATTVPHQILRTGKGYIIAPVSPIIWPLPQLYIFPLSRISVHGTDQLLGMNLVPCKPAPTS